MAKVVELFEIKQKNDDDNFLDLQRNKSSESSTEVIVENKKGRKTEKIIQAGKIVLLPWKYDFFLIGCFSLAINGSLYVWTQYTEKLKNDNGISTSQIVLLGVINQASIGIFQYPNYLFYQWLNVRYKAATADRIMTISVQFPLIASLLALGFLLLNNATPPFPLLIILMIIYGATSGNGFGHILSVINFNFNASNEVRRIAVAQLSVALGFGGIFFSIFYYFVLQAYPLSMQLFSLASFHTMAFLIRFKYLIRRKNVKSLVQDMDQQIESEDNLFDQINNDSENDAIGKATMLDYVGSYIVWLTCICSGFGLAIGTVWSSSLGSMALHLKDPSRTFTLNLFFLTMQTLGRIISAIIYAFKDNPYVMSIWQIFCVASVGIIVIKLNFSTLYVSTILCGLSFGGIWGSMPVITATCFPGNLSDYMRGIAIVYFSISLISVSLGQLYNYMSLNVDFGPNEYFSTFILYLSISLFIFGGSIFLAILIKKKIQPV